ncbi:MAG TPA: hypothetical protein QF764_10920 [Planctomycetota bacterium]|jgi:hypothetical protein|nr:hypothetical protein [Planctomycetota bacterium]
MTEAAADRTGEAERGSRPPQPERLDMVLRRLGFVPDAEDRLRRLELGLGFLCEELGQVYERFNATVDRLVEVEASLGRLRRGR